MYDDYRKNPHHETEADLHAYRKMYSDAIDTISGGTLGDVVRNSHIVFTLCIAVCSRLQMPEIVLHPGTCVFGTGRDFALHLMVELKCGAWYNQDPKDVAQVVDEGREVIEQSSDSVDSDEDKEDSDDNDASDGDEEDGDDDETSGGDDGALEEDDEVSRGTTTEVSQNVKSDAS